MTTLSQTNQRKWPAFMAWLLSGIMLLGSFGAEAQTPMYDNGPVSSPGGNSIPFGYITAGTRSQFLMPAGAFGNNVPSGRLISSIYFNPYSAISPPSSVTYSSMDINIGQPNISSLSTTWETNVTNVLSQTNYTVYPVGNSWMEIKLDKPIKYDPTKPIVVDIKAVSPNSTGWYMNYSTTVPSGYYQNYTTSNPSSTSADASRAYMYYFGFDLKSGSPDDAAVSKLISPVAFCASTTAQNLQVQIENAGMNQIKSLTINWSKDGVTQSPISYTSTLDTFGGTSSTNATVTLGTHVFNSGSSLNLKVWVSDPNGKTDTDPSNDTLQVTLKPALSGTFSINKNGSGNTNFTSFNAAVNALQQSGICGPVLFNVSQDTYTEQVTIKPISGASSTNTITFDGGSDSSKTILTSSSTGFVLKLDGADYVTFRDMTINGTNTSNVFTVHLTNQADYNTFRSCVISASTTATTTTVVPFGIMGATYTGYGNHGNYNTVQYCDIKGGYVTVEMNGSNTSTHCLGNKLLSNRITGGYLFGIRSYYQADNTYKGNFIDCRVTVNSYGIYSYYDRRSVIEANNIRCGYMGMYLYYANQSQTARMRVINNMVYTHTYAGSYTLYAYLNTNVDFLHNTFYQENSSGYYTFYMSQGSGNRIHNNIIHKANSAGGGYYAYYLSGSGIISSADYNLIYSQGGGYAYVGAAYTNLAALKAAGYERNSYDVMPNYVGLPDLHVDQTRGTPYGTDQGVAVDIDGDARCKLFPTVGADENGYGKTSSTVQFFGPNPTIDGTPTTYSNIAKGDEPKGHKWYIDGVLVSDSVHLYTMALTGKSSAVVKLVTESCSGKDSFQQTITINQPTQAPITDFLGDKSLIRTGETVKFIDISKEGPSSWTWAISPVFALDNGVQVNRYTYTWGSASTPNNIVRFNYPGLYRVCLTTANSRGTGNTECKVDYVEVMPSINMCDQTVIKDARGYLYDDGGPNGGPYGNTQKTCNMLIDPCASEVSLKMNMFKSWCTMQYLRIYDGVDKTGTLINGNMGSTQCNTNSGSYGGPGFTGGAGTCYAGNNLQCMPTIGDTFVAKSGKMYLEWDVYYGSSYSADGFEAEWWSTPRSMTPPVASFEAPDSVCVNQSVSFKNTSTGDEIAYFWDFDEDLEYFEYDRKDATYPFFATGEITVTMIAQNCGGRDTFTKKLVVFNPNRPTPDFTADNLNPTTNDVVFFTNTTPECIDDFKWKFTHVSGAKVSFANGTSDISQNPNVIFPEKGCWTVQLWGENMNGSDSISKTCYITVKDAYCVPSVATLIPDLGISQVVFANINNSSTQGLQDYQNFTPTVATNVEVGVTYELTVSRTSNRNNATRTVWIDWNADGDFNDAGERVDQEINSSNLHWTTDITVPSTVTLGATVMRIAITHGSLNNQVCGQNLYGEYEDYRLYVTTDKTPPVITLLGQDTVYLEQGRSYTDSGATAMDNLDGNITSKILLSQTPNFNEYIDNTYIFSYNVQDAAGNKAKTVQRVVIVIADTTAPVMVKNGSDTVLIAVGLPYTDAGLRSAEDVLDGDVMNDVITTNPVNTAIVDTYTVVYQVSDFRGNMAVERRIVIVIDTVAPVIVLNGADTVYHELGTPYTDLGATATDNYYQNLDLNVASNVDVNMAGIYTVSYSATDGSGNGPVVKNRTVIVRDSTPPVLSLIGQPRIVIEVNSTYSDPGYNVTDVDENVSVTEIGTFFVRFANGMADSLGQYTVTYVAVDGSGNSDTITRVIEVVDTEAPVLTLKGPSVVTVCRWKDYQDAGYDVSDNYKYAVISVNDSTGNFENTLLPGVYSVIYIAEDQSGNVSVPVQRVVFVSEIGECQSVTGIENMENKSNISIYPNPTNGQFVVKFTNINASERVKISVVDMLGREVKSVNNAQLSQDSYTVDMQNAEAGVYMVLIQNGENVSSHKITIVK